jgi:hypothetical protein
LRQPWRSSSGWLLRSGLGCGPQTGRSPREQHPAAILLRERLKEARASGNDQTPIRIHIQTRSPEGHRSRHGLPASDGITRQRRNGCGQPGRLERPKSGQTAPNPTKGASDVPRPLAMRQREPETQRGSRPDQL